MELCFSGNQHIAHQPQAQRYAGSFRSTYSIFDPSASNAVFTQRP
jgi:hypothetical protein